jgi:phage-related protein
VAGGPTIRIAILANARRAINGINATTRELRRLAAQARAGTKGLNGFSRGLRGIGKAAGFALRGIGKIGKALGVALIGFVAAGVTAGGVQLASSLVAAVGAAAPAVGVLPGAFLAAASAALTFKVATAGVADAMGAGFKAALSGNKNDLKKFNQSLSTLAPNARATVKEFVRLAPALQTARQSISNDFFRGMSTELKSLAGTYLPLASQHGRVLAQSMNRAALGIGAFLRKGSSVSKVTGIFRNIEHGVNDILGTAPSLARAFLPLASVSASFLPQLTRGLGDAANRFSAFMQKAEKSGKLKSMIQSGLDVVKQLGSALKSAGSILKSVFVDANAPAGGLFKNLSVILKAVAGFLNTADGMSAIGAIWATIGTIGKALGDSLKTVLPAIGQAVQALMPTVSAVAVAFSQFLTAVTPIVPVAAQLATLLGNQLAAMLPALAPVIVQIGKTLGDLGTAILPLLPMLGQVAVIIGQTLVQAAQAIMPVIRPLVGELGAAFLNIVTAVAPVVPVLAKAFASIVKAATPLIGPLVDVASTVIKALMPSLERLLPIVGDIATALGSALGGVLTTLGPSLGSVASSLGTAIADTLQAITPSLEQLLPVVANLASTFGQSFAQVFTALAPVLPAVASGFVALAPAVTGVLTAVTPLLPVIASIASTLLTVMNPAIGPLVTGFVALTGAVKAYSAAMAVVNFVQATLNGETKLWIALVRVQQGLTWIQATATNAAAAAQSLWAAAMDSTALASIRTGIALAAQKVATLAAAAAEGVMTAAQWLLDIAMDANPIGIIILAIGILIGLMVLLAAKSDTVRKWFLKVWDAIKWVGQAIAIFFAGFGRWFWNVGSDIVTGIWNGLVASWNWLKGKFASLVNMLPDWMKKILGIHSPSKVMAQLGEQIGTGLAQGITSSTAKVRGAMSRVSDVVTSGVDAGGQGIKLLGDVGTVDVSGTAAASGTTIHLTVNVPPTANPANVGRDVVRAIRSYERQLGRKLIAA